MTVHPRSFMYLFVVSGHATAAVAMYQIHARSCRLSVQGVLPCMLRQDVCRVHMTSGYKPCPTGIFHSLGRVPPGQSIDGMEQWSQADSYRMTRWP